MGKILSATSIKVEINSKIPIPYLKQYPLQQTAIDGIAPIIQDYLEKGSLFPVLVPATVLYYCSKKPNGRGLRFLQIWEGTKKYCNTQTPNSPQHTYCTISYSHSQPVFLNCRSLQCLIWYSCRSRQPIFVFLYLENTIYMYYNAPRIHRKSHLFSQILKADLEGLIIPEGLALI